jgi:pimeloyl-ACP methyl ester carboxylesterase
MDNAATNRQSMTGNMKNSSKALILILFFASQLSWAETASDLEKEKRWSEQITDSLVVGESCTLDAAGTPFLGIYTEASEGPSSRAVILLHGIGAHPDWPEVINPLRSDLPDLGWTTLSIQMPVLANDAKIQDYAPLFAEVGPRIEAAIQYLRDRDADTLVLIGHSLGASMAATWVANSQTKDINGLVLIGLGVITADARMNSLPALEKIHIPVLDLYGSRDLESVTASAKKRLSAANKSGNEKYRQLSVEGADHFFVGLEADLTRRVYGWLKSNFEKDKE